jgi:hypothetical protein
MMISMLQHYLLFLCLMLVWGNAWFIHVIALELCGAIIENCVNSGNHMAVD